MFGEFCSISFAKFVPAFDPVAEPFAERGARGKIFTPVVDRGIFLPQASRPEAINQDSRSVSRGGWFIDTLQLDPRGIQWPAHRSSGFLLSSVAGLCLVLTGSASAQCVQVVSRILIFLSLEFFNDGGETTT
jgi:hypothetical protein